MLLHLNLTLNFITSTLAQPILGPVGGAAKTNTTHILTGEGRTSQHFHVVDNSNPSALPVKMGLLGVHPRLKPLAVIT